MHYYQFHIGDYKTHTHHLTPMEDLAFRRLLDHYYLHESPIKQRDIARQIGMKDYEQDVLTVLDEFFVSTENGYINPRADKQIQIFTEHQATSAYGAFVRDNPTLKSITDKQLFIQHHMAGSISDYINLLKSSCIVDVPITPTSRGEYATNNHKPITNNHKPNNINTAPEGVSQEIWESFLKQRKVSRAAVSDTVINQIRKEADKANWTLEQALSEIVLRGWRGFKAEWVADKKMPPNGQSFFEKEIAAKKAFFDEMSGFTKNGKETIDMELTNLRIEK